ncbi:hypothetical protein HRI96_06625 [Treponema parvum]|uniref:Lipoprotein n=1 Tax=Treponema parvum TaxID=138851 RepID=A0A975F015_9SPIR|nr:hypothetical protein [Treponema parvum]QTQ11902.1 hypothetical protein HRI96_06625 [Treponema parvum]
MKKPALVTVFVSAVFLLFTSCSNLFQALGIENSSGKGSLRVVLPQSSPQAERSAAGASRLAVNVNVINTYVITLSKDNFVEEKIAFGGSSVTFSDLEEGTYIISGYGYAYNDHDHVNPLASGRTEIKVSAGKTTNAAFPLYTPPPPIVLWDCTISGSDMNVYIADTASLPQYSPLSPVSKSPNILEFDAARNLYTHDSFLSAASGYEKELSFVDDNGNSLEFSHIYCSEDNVLFMVVGSKELHFFNPYYKNDDERLVAKEITGDPINLGNVFIAVSRLKLTTETEGSRFLYTVAYDKTNLIFINTYKITRNHHGELEVKAEQQSPPIPLGTGGYGLEAINKKPNDPSITIYPTEERKVTDVRIHENDMYILFSYTYESDDDYYPDKDNNNYVSSGALLKVKLDPINGTPAPAGDFGNSGALGWTYELINSSPFIVKVNGHDKNLYGQWPSDENRGFFGPQKILALKSKKIWIADDGSIYDKDAPNEAVPENGNIVQKDRVVVVDLERESFESVYSFDGIGFSNTVKGSGF